MYLASRVLSYSFGELFTIRPLGDIHIGTVHHDRNHWLRDVEAVRVDPNCYWLGMGDYCECIVLADPRFSPEELAPEFRESLMTLACAQRDAFLRDVEPIKDRCLGLLEGNHEGENRRRHYVDVVRDACRELNAPYLGDTAFVRLLFDQRTVDRAHDKHARTTSLVIYAEHGSGGGRKTGAKINSLEDMMAGFEADIYLRGHVHQKLATKHPRLKMPHRGKSKLIAETRVCGLTGSYLRSYEVNSTSYGERKSYPPTQLGSIAIRFEPHRRSMEVVT